MQKVGLICGILHKDSYHVDSCSIMNYSTVKLFLLWGEQHAHVFPSSVFMSHMQIINTSCTAYQQALCVCGGLFFFVFLKKNINLEHSLESLSSVE